jgi:hypothetical protein
MQENKTFIQKSFQEKAIPKHTKHKWEDKMEANKTACQLPKKLYNDY